MGIDAYEVKTQSVELRSDFRGKNKGKKAELIKLLERHESQKSTQFFIEAGKDPKIEFLSKTALAPTTRKMKRRTSQITKQIMMLKKSVLPLNFKEQPQACDTLHLNKLQVYT